jgi:O-antigen ligase
VSRFSKLDADTYAAEVNNPFRKAGLHFAMAFLFFRFSGLHEILAAKLGFNTYVLYIVGIPAILFLIASDGLSRTLRAIQAKYWIGFACCLVMSIPFSDWRGGSTNLVLTYLRTDFIVLFLIVGLVLTWKECLRLLGMLAIAAIVVILLGQLFKTETMGGANRLEIATGLNMGNANDYAAILTLLLPFLGLVLIAPGRAMVMRCIALGGILMGLYMILATGSRGALIAIFVAFVMIILRLPLLNKIGFSLAALAIGISLWMILPGTITQRLGTVIGADGGATDADESGESRWYLFKKSLLFTAERPLFGVGPGEFADHEGFGARAIGLHGNWHVTHNSYTQVSSEAGIPAALFFIAALVSTYRLLNKTLKQARARPPSRQNATIAAAVLCSLIGTVAFCSSAFFLSLAYRFYFPALTAIALVMHRAAQREWSMESNYPSVDR